MHMQRGEIQKNKQRENINMFTEPRCQWNTIILHISFPSLADMYWQLKSPSEPPENMSYPNTH